ncbi:glutathione S-transferase family protein [Sandaracinobacteroides saxicola]|uniref:Glutathione S-transferase family protein n=1 Tax=Sandaracinobacteroides saxicola TaxID=2759707 RepID=A0A7G5IDN3_9SPHN|nr:glutathione S-transferase family protein [Sandaracinobacteroides saxicola]QMW21475.1 glutathione S-transferase family protein [Sandaracinobacteroides saxicola]
MLLYDMAKAPNPRRVRWFLAEKGVSLPMVQVDIMAGENLAPAFLAVNPRGVVPTLLLDDGGILDESVAICRYLEGLHPEPNLLGRDALEMARIESWQRRMEFEGMFNVAAAFRNTQPAYAERGMPGRIPPTPAIPALAERGLMLAAHWLAELDARLRDVPFVAGERFSIADITAAISVDFAKWVGLRPAPEQEALLRWQAEVKARPGARA